MQNSRELFLNIFENNKNYRTLNWELGYWEDTILRWYKEGLPRKNSVLFREEKYSQGIAAELWASLKDIPDIDVHNYFNFDEGIKAIPLNVGIIPKFDEEIYYEDEMNITMKRDDGSVVKTRKDGTSVPLFLEYPVKNKNDLKKIKSRYDTDLKK
ncbi:MAG: hypothetical protein M1409_00965, partial [Actinobacteria bacterium]|nr:hypothetical protein [Actinomycetota bacterium]